MEDTRYDLARLRDHLSGVPAGPVSIDAMPEVLRLVTYARHDFRGGVARGGRLVIIGAHVKSMRWDPPVLTMCLWHYGVFYDELRRWSLHVATGKRSIVPLQRRERGDAKRPQPPFNVAPIADELAKLIKKRRADPRLEWSKTGKVRVRTKETLPEASNRTTQGRRERLYRQLARRLSRSGWVRGSLGWWERRSGRPSHITPMLDAKDMHQVRRSDLSSDPWWRGLFICSNCGGVGGALVPPAGGRPVRQDCLCTRSNGPSEMWQKYHMIYAGVLCKCCGQVLLKAQSKFFVWFCEACKEQVGLLNGRLGRYAIPIGGHSLHGGFALKGDAGDLDTVIFTDLWIHLTDAMARLREWSHVVVRRVVTERWRDPPRQIPVEAYLSQCIQSEEEKMRRFREMLAFLQGLGPE